MRWIMLVLLLSIGTAAWTQTFVHPVKDQDVSSRSQHTTLRIDRGKVWVNGNLIPSENLPPSLRNIDSDIYYESTIAGVNEFTFNLGDDFYLVQDGKLQELPAELPGGAVVADNSRGATEAYYSQLKRESPGLFYGLSREGMLVEQVRGLIVDYHAASGKKRDAIREDIRSLLTQLYDINERNKELEIEELEDMIKAAKLEVQFRKENKAEIIDNSLDILLKR